MYSCIYGSVQGVPNKLEWNKLLCSKSDIESEDRSRVPCSRSKHATCVLDNFIYIHGGKDGNISLRDFWRYNTGRLEWEQIKLRGDKIPHLQGHSMVAYQKTLIVYGGEFGTDAAESPLWIISPDLNHVRKWRCEPGSNAPVSLRDHTATVYRECMYLFGGYMDVKGCSSEFWKFNLEDEEWELMVSKQKIDETLCGRYGHTTVIYEKHFWVYGGSCDLNILNDLWKYSLLCQRWQRIKCKGGPPPLYGHTASVVDKYMVLYGGETNGANNDYLWMFDFDKMNWLKFDIPTGVSKSLVWHSAVSVTCSNMKGENSRSLSYPTVRSNAANINESRPFSSPPMIPEEQLYEQRIQQMKSTKICDPCVPVYDQLVLDRSQSINDDTSPLLLKRNQNLECHLSLDNLVGGETNPAFFRDDKSDKSLNNSFNSGTSQSQRDIKNYKQISLLSERNVRSHSCSDIYNRKQNSSSDSDRNKVTRRCKLSTSCELIIEDLEYCDIKIDSEKLNFPSPKKLKLTKIPLTFNMHDKHEHKGDLGEMIELTDFKRSCVHDSFQDQAESYRQEFLCDHIDYNSRDGKVLETSVTSHSDLINMKSHLRKDELTIRDSDYHIQDNTLDLARLQKTLVSVATQTSQINVKNWIELDEMEERLRFKSKQELRACQISSSQTSQFKSYMVILGGKDSNSKNFKIEPMKMFTCQIDE